MPAESDLTCTDAHARDIPPGPGRTDSSAGGDLPVLIARGDGPHGELALRRRGDVLELIVDGVFAMDSAHTTTEVALATLTFDRLSLSAPSPGWRVLVGGLGLGYTARAVLADPRVGALDVVELHARLVGWVRDGLVPAAAGLLDDPRARAVVGDVRDVIARRGSGSLDAVLLDVDNGPDFLVHASNADVYRVPFLRAATRTLAPGGVLAIWSADPHPALVPLLREAGGEQVEEVTFEVERDGRRFTYAVYLSRRG